VRSLSHPPDIKHPKMVSNMCKSTSTTISGWRWSPFVHGARGALRCHGKICVLLVNEAAGINHRTWLTSYLLSCPSGERSSKACHFPLEFESPIVNQLSITLLKDVILSYDPCNKTHNSHQLAAGAAFFCCTWGPVLAGSRFFWGNQLRFFSLA